MLRRACRNAAWSFVPISTTAARARCGKFQILARLLVSAAAVKKAGGNKVVIVGEAPGDRLRFWSEGGNACLPNSGFCLHYTDGLFDMVKGCTGTSGCYGDQFDVNVGSLRPEINAPLTTGDYLAGRDRALDIVLEHLR